MVCCFCHRWWFLSPAPGGPGGRARPRLGRFRPSSGSSVKLVPKLHGCFALPWSFTFSASRAGAKAEGKQGIGRRWAGVGEIMDIQQHTIARAVTFVGVGLHSGQAVNMTIKPAPANSGFRFVRTDLDHCATIPAFMDRVVDTRLATTLAEAETMISTTEHLLAALVGLGIDNATIELDAAELPIMDGSAGPFVHVLKKVARKPQQAFRRLLKITKTIVFRDGDRWVSVSPFDGLKLSCEIDFAHSVISRQSYSVELSPERFVKEIARARTFGFMEEYEKLKEHGYARGGSLENAVVIDRFGVLNEGGLRFADEFVRHKVLDLLGDLALLGCSLLGHVQAHKSGHGQHLGLMREIAAHPECWEFIELAAHGDDGMLERLVTSTMAAGQRILPFLVPPTPTFGDGCRAACSV